MSGNEKDSMNASERQIKIMTWNIWHGKHLKEIVNHLSRSNPDVVGLQEVMETPENHQNTAQTLAQHLGFEHIFYSAFTKSNGERQGNAILSRFPIQSSKVHFLSGEELYVNSAETEPRIAVEASIVVEDEELRVFTTHLAYSYLFRRSKVRDLQVDNLLKIIPNKRSILLGDFNSLPDSDVIQKISQHLRNAGPAMSEPTWTVYPFDYYGHKETELRHRLDYIFTSSDIDVVESEVEKSNGSDHVPVTAKLRFK